MSRDGRDWIDVGLEPHTLNTLWAIRAAVAHAHGVPVAAITGPERHRAAYRPRVAFYVAAIKAGKWSLAQIGQAAGGRDHSTVKKCADKAMRRARTRP